MPWLDFQVALCPSFCLSSQTDLISHFKPLSIFLDSMSLLTHLTHISVLPLYCTWSISNGWTIVHLSIT